MGIQLTLEQNRLEEIKRIILEHKGAANAISAGEISSLLNIPEDDTVSTTRGLITKLILEECVPIGASDNEYFYIETKKELGQYIDYLDQKILQTTNRKTKVITNYEMKYGRLKTGFIKIDDI